MHWIKPGHENEVHPEEALAGTKLAHRESAKPIHGCKRCHEIGNASTRISAAMTLAASVTKPVQLGWPGVCMAMATSFKDLVILQQLA